MSPAVSAGAVAAEGQKPYCKVSTVANRWMFRSRIGPLSSVLENAAGAQYPELIRFSALGAGNVTQFVGVHCP